MTAIRNLSYRGGAILGWPLVMFKGDPTHSFKFLSLCLALVVAVAAGAGCATFIASSEPMPRPKGPLQITVSEEQPSSWTDMPPVVLHVPGSSLYLSGNLQEGPLVGGSDQPAVVPRARLEQDKTGRGPPTQRIGRGGP